MKRILAVALLCLMSLSLSPGQTIAKYAGEFMAIGVGGRALGLGGSYVSLASDATATYWNPAALTRIRYPEVVLMHDERFGNLMNYDYLSVALPYGSDASVGIGFLRLGVDGIPDTRNAWIDANGNGIFDDNNRPDYDKISFFNAADWAVYFTYARELNPSFSYGANVKLIRRDIADHHAFGIGFDAGLLYSPYENLSFGLNVQDITTTLIAWSTGRNELVSPTLKMGTSYALSVFGGRLSPTLDVDVRFENRRFASLANLGPVSFDPRAGLEFDFRNLVALRVGYSDIKQITLGAGLHFRKLDIDYSFARFGPESDNLGDTHRISLRLVIEEEKFSRQK